MSKSENQKPILPLFHLSTKFPDAKTIFTTSIPSIENFKEEALIVLDTNVLLFPYSIQPKSLDDIKKTYELLIAENRLFIPAQVAREFAKNRGEKIQNLFHEITLKQNINVKKADYKLLESIPEYNDLVKIEEDLNSKIKEYRKIVGVVLNHIRSWQWNDPVSTLYRELFKPEIVIETSITSENIEADLDLRLKNRISPGFKDASKDDRGIGDVIIWNTILDLGKDHKRPLIFVTSDEKNDWMLQSNNEALYPNFELIDEYSRVSDGKPFQIIKFSELLDFFEASKDVVNEVKNEELEMKHHSYELRINHQKFYIVAENSVFDWILNEYETKDIAIFSNGYIDLLVELKNGKKFGISVKAATQSRDIPRRLRELINRAENISNTADFNDFVTVIVCINSIVAENYFHWIHNRMDNEKQIGIILGYLDEYDKLVTIYDNFYKRTL